MKYFKIVYRYYREDIYQTNELIYRADKQLSDDAAIELVRTSRANALNDGRTIVYFSYQVQIPISEELKDSLPKVLEEQATFSVVIEPKVAGERKTFNILVSSDKVAFDAQLIKEPKQHWTLHWNGQNRELLRAVATQIIVDLGDDSDADNLKLIEE